MSDAMEMVFQLQAKVRTLEAENTRLKEERDAALLLLEAEGLPRDMEHAIAERDAAIAANTPLLAALRSIVGLSVRNDNGYLRCRFCDGWTHIENSIDDLRHTEKCPAGRALSLLAKHPVPEPGGDVSEPVGRSDMSDAMEMVFQLQAKVRTLEAENTRLTLDVAKAQAERNQARDGWQQAIEANDRLAARNTPLVRALLDAADHFANAATAINVVADRAADAGQVTVAASLRIVVAGVAASELEARDALPASDNRAIRKPDGAQ